MRHLFSSRIARQLGGVWGRLGALKVSTQVVQASGRMSNPATSELDQLTRTCERGGAIANDPSFVKCAGSGKNGERNCSGRFSGFGWPLAVANGLRAVSRASPVLARRSLHRQ